ncbi:sensor box histidine kinase [Natronomonas pharaonis DSM 2160]|uniref:histidine kinase n=1 Tax=Natronomonas pharaonis (strain ATCC 35678 / DSM 2160 / CIP 103997 / JCM 8858 / NBRC 14720 / NCIMB 2260 / Gabara) TaxID=348780 RepID=A0A1U7EV88_NATPD|nr:PAS domain-containing sensor histidine kinase [Natronomonas pharaonis]CAI48911.1 sensor box histidine kinase [Natronomonas pharaonis DSM 2160]
MDSAESPTPRDGDGNRWQHLIEHIQDAVVEFELVDDEPIVRDVNRAFVDVFGYERSTVLDAPLNNYIVPEWLDEEASSLDEETASGNVNYRRVRRQTADGLREFLYRGIPLVNATDRIDGFAVYTDLTDIVQQERRLQVLNRILRHNLRNRTTAIAGNTARLLEQLDEQSETSTRTAATIEREVEALRHLADEAGRIEQLTGSEDGEQSEVDVVPFLRGCVAEYTERYPASDFETDLPPTAMVKASHGLRAAVESLLENAVEHNPDPKPRVNVAVNNGAVDGWTDIRIEDDGPRIPERERRLVAGDADITPLHHGQGIGLWLAKWTTERFGGELAFETSEWGGNSVRLRFRSAD